MLFQFEFAYDLRDEGGNVFHSVGIVKCREMLEEGRWVLWDLNPGRKAWCWECSSDAERVIRHVKQSQCPRLVSSKNRRARTVRAQQEREQNHRSCSKLRKSRHPRNRRTRTVKAMFNIPIRIPMTMIFLPPRQPSIWCGWGRL